MTKQNLFVPKVKNHVSRNAFDLSQRRIFSSKCGEILPCFLQDCLPGDKFRVNSSTFSRTAPLNTAAFARIKQYYNFYFVPYRLLYRDFPSFVVQQSKSSKAATDITTDVVVPSSLPYVTESDLQHVARSSYAGDGNTAPCPIGSNLIGNFFSPVGTSRMMATRKLLQYLGYYKTTRSVLSDDTWSHNNSRLSLFPLLAYQKVYNDFYRFSQWENEQANTYNVDYMAGKSNMNIPIASLFVTNDMKGWYPASHKPNMFDLRYVNFTKDTFLGVVPTSQFGAVSTVQSADLSNIYIQSLSPSTKAQGAGFDPVYNDLGALVPAGDGPSSTVKRTQVRLADLSNRSVQSFDILSLRAAQAKQKFLEVTLSNNSDYKSQIAAHFNVNVSSLQSGLCDYIGGFSSDFNINTVTNTNLAAEGSTANYAANGFVQGNGKFDFECREHGLIIGVMYTLPFIDYSVVGYDAACLRTQFSDFALPEYDRLGYESVDPRLLTGDLYHTPPFDFGDKSRYKNLGYGPRYYDYKTNYDIVLGDFNKSQNGTQPNFVCSLSQNSMLHDFVLNLGPNTEGGLAPVLVNELGKCDVSFGLLGDLDFYNQPKYSSFKVYPSILNNIFSVYSSISKRSDGKYYFHDGVSYDQFYNVVDFNTQVIRNLDRLGLPY